MISQIVTCSSTQKTFIRNPTQCDKGRPKSKFGELRNTMEQKRKETRKSILNEIDRIARDDVSFTHEMLMSLHDVAKESFQFSGEDERS